MVAFNVPFLAEKCVRVRVHASVYAGVSRLTSKFPFNVHIFALFYSCTGNI